LEPGVHRGAGALPAWRLPERADRLPADRAGGLLLHRGASEQVDGPLPASAAARADEGVPRVYGKDPEGGAALPAVYGADRAASEEVAAAMRQAAAPSGADVA